MLKDKEQEIHSVVVDRPSKIEGFSELVDYVDKCNTYIFAISILILTEAKTDVTVKLNEDLDYFGGAVVDCARRPFDARIVKNRIEDSVQWLQYS